MKKQGHPLDRAMCASFARQQRARFTKGEIHGHNYSEWTRQVFIATRNKLSYLTRARKQYAGPVVVFSSIEAQENEAARAILREEHRNIEAQVAANRRDPLLQAMGWNS